MGRRLSVNLLLVTFLASLGPLQFGYNLGNIGAPLKAIEAWINATYVERQSTGNVSSAGLSSATLTTWSSSIAALFPAGGMVGALTVGSMAARYGRLRTMQVYSVVGLLGGSLFAVAWYGATYELLLVARFVVGLAAGAYTGVVPVYVSEIAPLHLRGAFGITSQLAITSGLLLAQILTLSYVLGGAAYWWISLTLTSLPAAALLLASLCFLPESPSFLKDPLLIAKVMRFLGRDALSEEAKGDESSDDTDASITEARGSYKSLFTEKRFRRPLVIAVVLQLSQQLSGVTGVFFFAVGLFKRAGMSDKGAELANIGIGICMVVSTFISVPLIDRLGRRPLMLIGLGGMFVSAVAMTIFMMVEFAAAPYMTTVACFIYIVFFAIGPGSIPWLITAELFRATMRPKAVTVAVFVNWASNTAVSMGFQFVLMSLDGYSFLIFAAFNLISFVFVRYFVPETRNRSIEEIEQIFNRRRKSYDSENKHAHLDDGNDSNDQLLPRKEAVPVKDDAMSTLQRCEDMLAVMESSDANVDEVKFGL